jgi:hypothetical protein
MPIFGQSNSTVGQGDSIKATAKMPVTIPNYTSCKIVLRDNFIDQSVYTVLKAIVDCIWL